MQILIVAATEAEIAPLAKAFGNKLEYLITGVGMTATAFALGQHLADSRYDLAISLGIAGSFDRTLDLGAVVEVSEDTISELGAENGEEFISLSTLGFGDSVFTPTTTLKRVSDTFRLPQVKAVTVNTVHGNNSSIERVVHRLSPQVESMEGAAFFYACTKSNLPCLQIRAVSNYVEKRNRDNWKIGLAIENLNKFAILLVAKLFDQRS